MKVFVSVYPFAKINPLPLQTLKASGLDISLNPYNRKLKPDETKEFAKDADLIIAGTEDLTPLIDSAPNLRFVSRVGIGLDSVPLELCRQKGILVSYTPDAVTNAVAELILGEMVVATRFVSLADSQIRNGIWTRPIGKSLHESKIGLIGFGRVGQRVANLLVPFFPQEVLVHDILDKSSALEELQKKYGLHIHQTSKEEVLAQSDIISLHLPLTPLTKNFLTLKEFQSMKSTTTLLHFCRGTVVNETDLYQVLKEKRIRWACVDVFEEEPYFGPLTELENTTLTQHMGSCTEEARLAMELGATEEVIRFVENRPLQNLVPESEYEMLVPTKERPS